MLSSLDLLGSLDFHGNLSFFVEFARHYREGEVRSLHFSKDLFFKKSDIDSVMNRTEQRDG